jgi:hypothetical protein
MKQFLLQAECEILGIFTMFWRDPICSKPRRADFARMARFMAL